MNGSDARATVVSLRAWARAAREALGPQARAQQSARITEHLLGWDAFKSARTVMAYASTGAEVETDALLAAVLRLGKQLALPRCENHGMMVAVEVLALPLHVGKYGIRESAGGPVIARGDIDLILAPGLLFDRSGGRIGQGGGYYDRYLAGYDGCTCGLAYNVQLLDHIPQKPHDVPVCALVTEDGFVQPSQ